MSNQLTQYSYSALRDAFLATYTPRLTPAGKLAALIALDRFWRRMTADQRKQYARYLGIEYDPDDDPDADAPVAPEEEDLAAIISGIESLDQQHQIECLDFKWQLADLRAKDSRRH